VKTAIKVIPHQHQPDSLSTAKKTKMPMKILRKSSINHEREERGKMEKNRERLEEDSMKGNLSRERKPEKNLRSTGLEGKRYA
jgi:hypothetical protein